MKILTICNIISHDIALPYIVWLQTVQRTHVWVWAKKNSNKSQMDKDEFCHLMNSQQVPYLPASSLSRYLAARRAPYTSLCSAKMYCRSSVFSRRSPFTSASRRPTPMAAFCRTASSFSWAHTHTRTRTHTRTHTHTHTHTFPCEMCTVTGPKMLHWLMPKIKTVQTVIFQCALAGRVKTLNLTYLWVACFVFEWMWKNNNTWSETVVHVNAKWCLFSYMIIKTIKADILDAHVNMMTIFSPKY